MGRLRVSSYLFLPRDFAVSALFRAALGLGVLRMRECTRVDAESSCRLLVATVKPTPFPFRAFRKHSNSENSNHHEPAARGHFWILLSRSTFTFSALRLNRNKRGNSVSKSF